MQTIKIVSTCHKAVGDDDSLQPVVVPANTSTSLCGSASQLSGEIARQWVQNTGANDCFVALNNTCDLSNYDVYLPAKSAPFELTPYVGAVSCFSIAGTTATVVRLVQGDNNSNVGVVTPTNQLSVPG